MKIEVFAGADAVAQAAAAIIQAAPPDPSRHSLLCRRQYQGLRRRLFRFRRGDFGEIKDPVPSSF